MSIYSYIYIFICFYTFKPFEFVICIISTWRERKPETVTKSMCVLFWFLLYISFCVVLQRDLYDAGVHDHVNFCNIESAMKQLCAHCIMCVFFLIDFCSCCCWFFFMIREKICLHFESSIIFIYAVNANKQHTTKQQGKKTRWTLGNSSCLYSGKQKKTNKKNPPKHIIILHAKWIETFVYIHAFVWFMSWCRSEQRVCIAIVHDFN